MNNFKRAVFILAAVVLAAVALPASAAKQISLQVPAGPLTASTTQIQVVISNDGNSNANSFEVDWIPSANFTVQGGFITSQPSNVGTMLATGVYGAPFKGLVFNKQAPAKTTVAVTLNVTVTLSCPSTPITWKAAAWTGSPGPLSTSFTLTPDPNQTTIATGAGTCGTLSISAPTSALLNTGFSVMVNEVGGPGGASVTLSSPSCPSTGGGTQNAAAGVHLVTFSSFALQQLGHCTVTATDPTGGYSSANADVYIGTLDCSLADQTTAVFPPVPGSPGYFASLPTGVTTVSQPGFAAGYRFKNDKGDPCQLVNYTFTNNITGTSAILDASGNLIPPNSAGLVWDLLFQPNAVFVYMLTFQPEYVDPTTGLPNKKTKFCILGTSPTDCTQPANQQNLQACTGTAFSSDSIPGSDPACIVQETWTTVDPSLCPAWTGQGTAPACVRNTDTILDARDPPISRG